MFKSKIKKNEGRDDNSSSDSLLDDNDEAINRIRWKSKQENLDFEKMIVNKKDAYVV